MNKWVKKRLKWVKKRLNKAAIYRNRRRGYGYCVAGIRVPIDTTILSPLMEKKIATGRNQTKEFVGARGVIRSGDVVLELGGGLGVLSAAIRRHTRASRIVSFEPNPDLFDFIKRTHQQNAATNIEVRQAVVMSGVRSSTIAFYRHPDVSSSSLYAPPDAPPEAVLGRVDVPVVKLEDLLIELTPNVLIVDTEGGELELFEGIEDLGTIDRIVLELHPWIYGTSGVLNVFKALCRLGFAYDADLSFRYFVVLRRPLPSENPELRGAEGFEPNQPGQQVGLLG